MTLIVALRSDDGVWVGSDGRVCDRYITITDQFQKWRKTKRNIWWGAAGYTRIYALAELNRAKLDEQESCVLVCEALRKIAVEDGWSVDDSEKGTPTSYGFDLLATDGNEIVNYRGDGSFVRQETTGDFAATGGGRDFALGAVSIARRYVEYSMAKDEDCEEILEAALQAACDYDQGVGGEFFIEKVTA